MNRFYERKFDGVIFEIIGKNADGNNIGYALGGDYVCVSDNDLQERYNEYGKPSSGVLYLVVFETKGGVSGEVKGSQEAADRFVDNLAENYKYITTIPVRWEELS